ncbi:MAG: FecR domain-containing protein [Myxococcales bacterium]|nr:FecR domain-containing protein [Myxococcales bacterium]
MADPRGPLSEHVHFVVTDREIDEGWQQLDSALRPERRWTRFVIAGAVTAALIAGVIGLTLSRKSRTEGTLEAGAVLAAGSAPLQAQLREGSTVRAEASSKGALEIATASEVRVRLDEGSMHFDVAKNPARRFVVKAGRVEVRVVGTAFTVKRSIGNEVVNVTVDRGVVEVWVGDEQRAVLNAGQSWNEGVETAALLEPEVVAEEDTVADETPLPADSPRRPAAPRKKSRPAKVAAATDEPLPPPVISSRPPLPDDPSTLFRLALDARRAGHARDAADAFSVFLAKFPTDSRAGLVLFELGRLQMDQLHAPSSAVESLEQSIARSPQGSYAEDAMARLVQLHHEQHRAPACRDARESYLKRFPAGVHAATLQSLCSF